MSEDVDFTGLTPEAGVFAEIIANLAAAAGSENPVGLLSDIRSLRRDAERYRKVRKFENTIDNDDEGCEACMAAYDSWADSLPGDIGKLAEALAADQTQSISAACRTGEQDFNEISFEVKFRVEPIKAIEESEYILNEFMYLSFLLQARAAYVNAFSEWMKKNYPIMGSDEEEQAQIDENYRNDIEVSLKNPASLKEMISEEAILERIKELDALYKRPDAEGEAT